MSLFKHKKDTAVFTPERLQAQVNSVLGPGIHWIGDLHGTGGVRIEGTMQGDIVIKGLVVIGETGKVICPELKAETVVVAGTVQGNITCQKLEIRSTGRVWGDVVTVSFSSEDGAFCAVKCAWKSGLRSNFWKNRLQKSRRCLHSSQKQFFPTQLQKLVSLSQNKQRLICR